MPDNDERARCIADLRLLLDFLEAHPDIPIDKLSARVEHCVLEADDPAGIAAVEAAARDLGVTVNHKSHVTAEKSFGSAAYRIFYVPNEQIRRHAAHSSYYGQVEPDTEGA